MSDQLPASALHALCVYAEPLVVGRRVVVFGEASSRFGERLLEQGAHLVHVYDPVAARAATAPASSWRGLTVGAFPTGPGADFDVRDGAFDVAIVLDLAEVPAPAILLGKIRRLLTRGGAALIRTRAPEAGAPRGAARPGPRAVDYYELFDLVALQFAHVRMVGEVPWRGVALAELGGDADAPDVTVDTQLAPENETPTAFVALASQEDVRLAEYALVQLPFKADVVLPTEPVPPLADEHADLAAAQLRASLLEAQVEELRARRNQESVAHAEAIAALEAELAFRITELQAAESRTRDDDGRTSRAVAEVRARDLELAQLRDQMAVVRQELEQERSVRSRLEAELVARLTGSEAARAELESSLALARVELEALLARAARYESAAAEATPLVRALEVELAVMNEGHGVELGVLEAALQERAGKIRLLEVELGRREQMIHDLVQALEEAGPVTDALRGGGDGLMSTQADDSALSSLRALYESARAEAGDLRLLLDQAALEMARQEGERATAAWRVQELEQEVERLQAEQSELTLTIPPAHFASRERQGEDALALSQRLAAAEDELDVLRRALAQEHQARSLAEAAAGQKDALAKAEAEVRRQAALLEKFSRELEAKDGVRRNLDVQVDDGTTDAV